MSWDQLGSPGERGKGKGLFILYMIIVIAFLMYASIPGIVALQTGSILDITFKLPILFFVIMGIGLGLIPIAFDMVTGRSGKDNQLEHIDSVTIEDPAFSFMTPNRTFITSFLLAGILLSKLFLTGSAWVVGPEFSIFASPLGNALISLACGLVENWFFFYVLFPSTYKNLNGKIDNAFIALTVSMLLIALGFVTYHNWRYVYNQPALVMVFIFSVINTLMVALLRSAYFTETLHGINNFLWAMGIGNKAALVIAI